MSRVQGSDHAAPEEPGAEEQLESRSDRRRANATLEESLARLAKQLVELSERKLEKLQLPELVLDAVLDTRAITSAPAKNRQLRVVRSTLRDNDWAAIKHRVDSLLKHGTVDTAAPPASADAPAHGEHRWLVRLVGEGTPALDALLAEYPKADRNHLRTLIRNAQKASAERRERAEEKLAHALRSLLHRG